MEIAILFLHFQAPVSMNSFMYNDEESKFDPTLNSEVTDDKFDITSYVSDTSELPECKPDASVLSNFPSTYVEKKVRIGGKKIDMNAQKYVIDKQEDDHIDVETVPDGSLPVLEAGDVNSLLEQFEASEEFHTMLHSETNVKIENVDSVQVKTEPITIKEENNYCSQETEDVMQGTNVILIDIH